MKTRRINKIDSHEQYIIFIEWESGHYYQKELLAKYRITAYTLSLIINRFKGVKNGRFMV